MILLLGLLDILAGATLFAQNFGLLTNLGWVLIGYLVIKTFYYNKNWSSYVDLAVAGIFFIAILGHYNLVSSLGVLWLVQKGIFSLF